MDSRITSSARRSASVTSEPSDLKLTAHFRYIGIISASAALARERANSRISFFMGKGYHVAQYKESGSAQSQGFLKDIAERARASFLTWPCGPRNECDRYIRRTAVLKEVFDDCFKPDHAHEDNDGSSGFQQSACRGPFGGIERHRPRSGDHEKAVIVISMREWKSGRYGRCSDAADARYDFKPDASRHQCIGLFAAAPEYKRVAAFEPANGLSLLGEFNHQPVNFGLLPVFMAVPFSDIDQQRISTGLGQQASGNKAIVKNDVGFPQTPQSLDRNQIRIAGPG